MQAIKPYLSNWLAAHAFSPPENQPMERTDIFLDELNLKTFRLLSEQCGAHH